MYALKLRGRNGKVTRHVAGKTPPKKRIFAFRSAVFPRVFVFSGELRITGLLSSSSVYRRRRRRRQSGNSF